jgi:Zn-dependent protease
VSGLQFQLFGIPIRVHPLFLLTAVILGRPQGDSAGWLERLLVWVVVVFAGVLLHELGHAFMGRFFGLTPNVELYLLGGLTWWSGARSELSPGRSILVSVAGPAVGIAIGLVAVAMTTASPPAEESLAAHTLRAIIFVNLGWGVLNLLPVLPLDGGNVLASFLEMFAARRGRRIARYLSIVVAVAMAAAALGLGLGLLPVLLGGFFAFSNWRSLQAERQLAAEAPLREHLLAAHKGLFDTDAEAVLEAAEILRTRAATSGLRGEGQLFLAWGRFLRDDLEGARTALDALTATAMPDPVLEGAIALQRDDEEGALRYFDAAFGPEAGQGLGSRLVAAFVTTGRYDLALSLLDAKRARGVEEDAIRRLAQAAVEAEAPEAEALRRLVPDADASAEETPGDDGSGSATDGASPTDPADEEERRTS